MLKPILVRIALLLVCIAWTIFEVWHDPNSIWFWMFLGITVYAVYEFFVSPKYRRTGAAPAAGGGAAPE